MKENPKVKKSRLDLLLVERGLAETREKAKRMIMAGLVYSDGERLEKPGMKVPESISLHVKGDPLPYVSRGGLKLEKALKEFDLSVEGKVVIDIGASTGGFTDCALQKGARSVYAVDSGYNQLAWKLRRDERVAVMERTNFRYMKPEDLPGERPTFATIDVSFISLTRILPPLTDILLPGGDVVALIKPQFEAGREMVGKKGIVRDPKVHIQVLETIIDFALKTGYDVCDLTFSPITGGDGNIEFLCHMRRAEKPGQLKWKGSIPELVREAHSFLKIKEG
jgi:hemolysin TlyA family protein